MASINLRPWRAELRAEKQKEFITMLVASLLLGAAIAAGWHMLMQSAIDYQLERNRYIQSEVALLEQQIREIDNLRQQRDALIDRMRVIQDLQGKRPVIVRLFDELVRSVPDGVFLTELNKSGELLSLKGVGETNSRISTLMRNLDASEWFTDPNLTSVKAWQPNPEQSQYEMTVIQRDPAAEETGGDA